MERPKPTASGYTSPSGKTKMGGSMNSADIQYMRLVKLIQAMDKRLAKIEEALQSRPQRKTLELPKKANNA